MRRFKVAAIAAPGATLTVDREGSHHLLDVVHIRRGERVLVFDGSGDEAPATLTDVQDGVAVLTIDGPIASARPAHPLHLVLAVLKGPAMDDAIRMATEAGATCIRPFLASRSIARGERVDRWERVALSAAQQCGRGDVPEVQAPTDLAGALAGLAGCELFVAVPGAPRAVPAKGPAAVVVGPEGGLTESEVRAVLAAGGRPIGLGRFVLRADTASAVAVALVAPDGEA